MSVNFFKIFSVKNIALLLCAGFLFFGFANEVRADITTGLTSHFNLDGGTSGSISNNTTTGFEDSSGSSNGTAKNTNGTGMAWTTGQIGTGAVVFDGIDDYVTMGNTLDMSTNSWSISLWVKTISTAAILGLVAENGSPAYFRLEMLGGGSLRFYMTDGAITLNSAADVATISNGAWHHVVFTVDKTSATGLRIYYDGTSKTLGAYADLRTLGSLSSTGDFIVGGRTSGAGKWDGSIDDVRVYSRALSSSDVTELYAYRPDVTNPAVSTLSPADDATGVAIGANAVITFDEPVVVGTGNITIKKTSDNSTVETIAVTSGQVTGGGTNTIVINPSSNLDYSTGYYIQIAATAFDDTSGNSYAGISDTTSWSFTTGEQDLSPPTVNTLSPTDNATNVATTTNLVITFNEGVNQKTGNIVIYRTSDNAVIETIDVTSGQVTGDGTDTITINPSVTLAYSTEYYVLIDATAFDDTSGNSYAGITSTSVWSFTTKNEFDTYYVSVADGDDTNCTGLASTAYVSGTNQPCPWKTIAKVNASTFNPGDSILFKRGETWYETLTVPSSGSSSHHIVFGAYGSGNLPIIDAEGTRTKCIHASAGIENITFQYLRLINATTNGIDVVTGNHTFDHMEADNDYTGFNATGASVVTASYLTATNNSNEGFGMHVTAKATVANSTFTDNSQGINVSMSAGAGSTLSISDSYFSNITDEIYMAPDITTSVTRSRFVFKATNDHGVWLQPGDTLSYSTFDLTSAPSGANPFMLESAGTLNVYNVTVYGGSGANHGGLTAPVDGIINIYNSIFYNFWRAGYMFTGGELNAHNNVFYDIEIKNLTANTGEVTSDPLFVDAANGDFRLQSNSPAINAGTDVGLTTDYAGNPITGLPDIGAYEYVDTTAPNPGNSGIITTASITSNSLTLNWTKGTDTVSAQSALKYRVFKSTSNNIDTVANIYTNGTPLNASTTDIATLPVTSLSPSTTYYFNVIVQDEAGNTSAYTTKSETTLSNVTTITSFNFASPATTGTVDNTAHTVALTVPFGTTVTSLTPTITLTTGATISPTSGTPQNFTSSVNYTVTAQDGTTQQVYAVTVTIAPNTAKAITAFDFNGLTPAVVGTIDETGKTIALTVPYGTAVTALVPTITHTGASISPSSGAAGNFTTPQTYTVTAANASTVDYTITVTVGAAPVVTTTSTSRSGGGGGCIGCWVPPSVPTGGFNVSINQNTSTTSNRVVTLNFNAKTDVKKIAISLTGDFADAGQEVYTPTKQFDLCSKFGGLIKNPTCSSGKYTVYAKFYTASGIASPVASSSVILDTTASSKYNFTRNLQLHMTGKDVKALQQYLNTHGFIISKTGAGSPGKETTLFGTLTYKALVKFQKSLGWSGTGFFGPMTRDYINKQ